MTESLSKDPLAGLTLKEASQAIRASKQVHSKWYGETYPDVQVLGMNPAEHYLKYGAEMGRNPGKGFFTRFYEETYPEVAESGINPLLHYVLYGEAQGYNRKPTFVDVSKPPLRAVNAARAKLGSLGFDETPIVELKQMLEEHELAIVRATSARELALWNMRKRTEDGYREALGYIALARAENPPLNFRKRLATVEVLCHHFLGDVETGRAKYEQAVLNGETSVDLMFVGVGFQNSPQDRMSRINLILRQFDISPLALMPAEDGVEEYDRLTSGQVLPEIEEGPKVTVLIAAYDASDTLPTALRSLQEQTWKNLEIIVIDDCSPDEGATCKVVEEFAARDPRISLIRMQKNGGAYIARNSGLDAATGEFVTIHDADDWSHPQKVEIQARYLEENEGVMGCTSQQARCRSDMHFDRWSGSGVLLFTNTSSFMYRRAPIKEKLGYWDTVRFAADNELVRRIMATWGDEAIVHIPTGPLSFQRDSDTSIVADDVLGINGSPFGVRRQYLEAQKDHHARGGDLLKYHNQPDNRPFPAPRIMSTGKSGFPKKNHYPVIITSDFRLLGGSSQSNSQEIICQKRAGIPTAIFPMYRYDVSYNIDRPIAEEVWNEVRDGGADILSYGEHATCDLLIIRYPPVLYRHTTFIPKIDAGDIRVIVNQPPQGDYTEDGLIRYELEHCADNIRRSFGKDATWHPIGPLVRDAMNTHHAHELQHINLSDWDWSNIIDIQGWSRGARTRGPSDRLRIGRHSRDHEHKWPATREDILALYPAADDIEIHVLGGANVPDKIVGGLSDNWTVHEFGSKHPRDFLADIDVFIYFSHPAWVESFGRTIIEAMAVGVPVILPEIYRPLFQDAAIYATPADAVQKARQLHADPVAYDAQVQRAINYAAANFSYDTHLKRIGDIRTSLNGNT